MEVRRITWRAKECRAKTELLQHDAEQKLQTRNIQSVKGLVGPPKEVVLYCVDNLEL